MRRNFSEADKRNQATITPPSRLPTYPLARSPLLEVTPGISISNSEVVGRSIGGGLFV
jgi:hypothetical protein